MLFIRCMLLMIFMSGSGSVYAMKLVSAEISQSSLKGVTEALYNVGITQVTTSNVMVESLPEETYAPKVKLEVAIEDATLDAAIEAITKAASASDNARGPSSKVDDVITVVNLEQAIRIRP